MNVERLTSKSQEALRDAQTLAVRRNHQGVDVEHLLAALLAQSEGVAPVLLERAGVPIGDLRQRAEQDLSASKSPARAPGAPRT
jgi:ATP-dependent Clp protease ATP-binding subunit ClpB